MVRVVRIYCYGVVKWSKLLRKEQSMKLSHRFGCQRGTGLALSSSSSGRLGASVQRLFYMRCTPLDLRVLCIVYHGYGRTHTQRDRQRERERDGGRGSKSEFRQRDAQRETCTHRGQRTETLGKVIDGH